MPTDFVDDPQRPPSQPQPQQPQRWGAPQAAQAPAPCRLCGSWPAAHGRMRGHRGLILLMGFRSVDGPFCRDCGLATFRDMTAATLVQGWWSPLSLFATVATVLYNLSIRGRFAVLPAPNPPPPGWVAIHSRPLDPGLPVLQRPAALGLLVPLALLVAILVSGALASRGDAGRKTTAGECVQGRGSIDYRVVSCSEDHVGQVLARASSPGECPREADAFFGRDPVLCVDTRR